MSRNWVVSHVWIIGLNAFRKRSTFTVNHIVDVSGIQFYLFLHLPENYLQSTDWHFMQKLKMTGAFNSRLGMSKIQHFLKIFIRGAREQLSDSLSLKNNNSVNSTKNHPL